MSRIVLPDLPRTWMKVRLRDIARIVYGEALPTRARNKDGDVDVYGSGGIVGKHDASLHSGPSIIIGRKGSVGSIYFTTRPFWCIDTAFYLDRMSDQVDIEFLSYLLTFLDLQRLSIVVGVPGLNRSDLDSTEFQLPTLPEQQRIVAILRQADELRRMRREGLEQTQRLSSALFLEIFGNLLSSKGESHTPEVRLGEFVDSADYGVSVPLADRGNVAVVRMNNITIDGWLELDDIKYCEELSGTTRFPRLRSGDLLFNRTNSKDLVGKTCLWESTENDFTFASYLIRVRLKEGLLPEYVWGYLNSPIGKIKLFNVSRQAVSMANINTKELSAIKLPKPPLKLQERFALIVHQLGSQRQSLQVSSDQMDHFFQVLVPSAFTGNITNIWRKTNRRELEAAARSRDAALGRAAGEATVLELPPIERAWLPQPERDWLLNQLSKGQGAVWKALQKWTGTLIPAEEIDEFRRQCFSNGSQDNTNTYILRALGQLAGLGLVVKASVPSQQGEYVTGYRRLREDELSHIADGQSLAES